MWRTNGNVEAQFEEDRHPEKQVNVLIGNYRIGEEITYQIKVQDRVVHVTISDGHGSREVSSPYRDRHWDTDKVYFKLGAYVQDGAGRDGEGGKVSFYAAAVQHGEDGGAGGGSCSDTPPDDRYTCAQQAEWSQCGEPWTSDRCDESCGRCR